MIGKFNFRILLIVFVCILMASYTHSQVVQYEYKVKYYKQRGKYVVLQVDYTNKRFVYRLSCDSYRPGECILGYIEMYGAIREKPDWLGSFNAIPRTKKYKEQEFEMEIYDWLFMRPLGNIFSIYHPKTSESPKEKENPKMILIKYSDDFVRVTYDNILEVKYPEFYLLFSHINETMRRSKKIKLDKKMYEKEMYKYIVKEQENLIYNDEVFLPFDFIDTRIYRYGFFPSVYEDGLNEKKYFKMLIKIQESKNK